MFRRTRRAAVRETEQRAGNPEAPDDSADHSLEDDEPLPDADESAPSDARYDEPEPEFDDEPVAPPIVAQPAPPPEPIPARARAYEPEPSTTIGPATVIEGTIRTPDDLRIEGSLSGALEVRGTVVIEQGGSVDADVDAHAVRVEGRLNGDIRCRERLEALAGSRIEGRFATELLIIDEGAVVSGTFAMRTRGADEPDRRNSNRKNTKKKGRS